MTSSLKYALGFVHSSPIMLDRCEPCRGPFSIFEKKSSIFSFGKQKDKSLTFCAKISSDRQIWLNRYCNNVEWTQEMLPKTYHHAKSCLDKKIEIDKKKIKIIFSLPISLRATFKLSLRKCFSAKTSFRFLSKF